MNNFKSLQESGILAKGISETNNETKEQKGIFRPVLLGTLAAISLDSALTGKAVIRAGKGAIRVGENV